MVSGESGKIIFTLSQPVNQLWRQAFHSQTVLQYWSGLSPQDFAISGTTAEVRADERAAQHARDHLERYLQRATEGHKRGFLWCANFRLTRPLETSSFLSAAPFAAPACACFRRRLPLLLATGGTYPQILL